MVLDILVVLMIVGFGTFVASRFDKESHELEVEVKPCRPHTWTTNHLEQLQCTECNYVAGAE